MGNSASSSWGETMILLAAVVSVEGFALVSLVVQVADLGGVAGWGILGWAAKSLLLGLLAVICLPLIAQMWAARRKPSA